MQIWENKPSSKKFLSTPSARRATLDSWHYGDNYTISIHALREEGDIDSDSLTTDVLRFLSTPSARRATPCGLPVPGFAGDFYPRPPRGGRRPAPARPRRTAQFLSTPSARRATPPKCRTCCCRRFLSTPSARRATPAFCGLGIADVFLSTPSARRATPCVETLLRVASISIHALREEGDVKGGFVVTVALISIHALREEGDLSCFQPAFLLSISIHALREEGDPAKAA